MRPPRLHIRTLMLAIALLAVVLCAVPTVRRWEKYRDRARVSADMARTYAGMAAKSDRDTESYRQLLAAASPQGTAATRARALVAGAQEEAQGFRELSAWADGLAEKYRKAAARPWLSVPDDPPFRATGNITAQPDWDGAVVRRRRK